MTILPPTPHDPRSDWRLVDPPPELWPLVVASTVERTRIRRQVIRSLRVPLAIIAAVLVVLSSATTVWVVRHLPSRGQASVADGRAPLRTRGTHAPSAPSAPRAPRPQR